jgi:anti-anti-sigma factor
VTIRAGGYARDVSTTDGPLKVDVANNGDEIVLTLTGELDPHTAPVLRDEVDSSIADGAGTLVLDVGGLRFIDSSGLRVIISAHKAMASRDGHLVLRSATETTRRLLDITGLTDHLEMD